MNVQNKDYSWLDELFGDIRSTCEDCEHPRCISRIKSAKFTLQSHIDEHYIGKGEAKPQHNYTAYDVYTDDFVFWCACYKKQETQEGYRLVRWTQDKEGEVIFLNVPHLHTPIDLVTESEVEQKCIEARINELSHVDGLPTCFIERNGMIVHLPIDKRLGELRWQLSTNNKDTLERSSDDTR